MEPRRERRVNNEKYTGKNRRRKLAFLWRFIRRYKMCRKSHVCPEFERRTSKGITSLCANCEYIKKERRILKRWRIALLTTFIIFVISTYLIY